MLPSRSVPTLSLLLGALLGLAACGEDVKEDTGVDTTDPTSSSSPPTTTTPTTGTTTTGTTTGTTTTGTTTGTTTTGTSTTSTPSTGTEALHTFMPSDENVLYTGRWSFEDPDTPWCAWQACSFIVQFEGTGLQVILDAGTSTEYFRVIVDDDHENSVKFPVSNRVETYNVATDLPWGTHKVEMVKETYLGTNATVHGFGVFGPGLVPPPERPARKLMFYGDSNLAGASLSHEENRGGAEYIGTHFGLAGITARMFGAEYHNVSASGETISGLNTRFDRMDWGDEDPQWDFARFPAEVVIVNIGANDLPSSEITIKGRYHDLLDDLRVAHPDAHIVLYNGWGWDYDEPANYTDEVVAARGDDNLSVAIFPWVFEQWHGCEYDHAGMALLLADHLETVMGWEAGPADVMTGYGEGGDLANGSFEEVAPFGGYGWRYVSDPDVQRIEDATAAHDGSHFIRLSDRANIHQPNPATANQVVTATLWLKGESGGEQATIVVDFRDQEMWTDPIDVTLQTVTLTADWAEYSISATAPEAVPAVFHTRLTIQAGEGDTIDVDALAMTTI
jgi:hypothetical protein